MEHLVGDAEADAPGEHARAADASALKDADERRLAERHRGREAGLAPAAAHRLHRRQLAVLGRSHPVALFDDDDAPPRARELARHDGAARARADDDGVGLEVQPLTPRAPAQHVQRASFSHRFLAPSPG